MIAGIEAPFAFLQEPVKMFGPDAAETPQMPFRLIPKVSCSIDMVSLFRGQP